MNAASRKAVIALEQQAVDRAYDCYEAALAGLSGSSAAEAAASGKDSIGARGTAEAMAAEYGGLGGEALVITRVDVQENDADAAETLYIGRRLVTDSTTKDVVVVSWTNPLAARWRSALPDEPGDVRLRRQLRCSGRTVEDYFDDISSAPALTGVDGDGVIAHGEPDDGGVEPAVEEPPADAAAPPRPFVPSPRDIARKARKKPRQVDEHLLRELHRSRSGRMRDIVETIRRDQMALVTEAPEGVLIVQGGPGTGKSAVGLHRVTWLVDNSHFGAEDILVVGPHQGFLDYVGRVLPTLGTRNVTAVHLARLWEGDIRAADPPEVRRVKSDERMAEVLRRRVEGEWRPDALETLLTAPANDADEPTFVVRIGSTSLRLPRSEIMELIHATRSDPGAYRSRRDRFRSLLVDRLHNLLVRIAPRRGRDAGVRRDLERNRQVVALVERAWPTLSPEEALRSLLDSPDRLRQYASGILDDGEQVLLHRPRAAKAAEEPWALDDLVCLEELRFLIAGETPNRYRHIVVDEAQDLTPMQARSLRRRCPDGSMTVVGDLAQATGPHTYADWERLGGLLAGDAVRHETQLNVSYRVPAQIMEFVHPLAQRIAPASLFPLAVRGGDGEAVRLVPTTSSELADATVARVARLVGTDDRRTQRSIAVIVPDGSEWRDRVRERIDQAEGVAPDARASVFVLDAAQAKGMEFDHVLVLDPTAIADSGPAGLRQLYVALTRSTQSLTVLHTSPLPTALAGDLSDAPTEEAVVDATNDVSEPERPTVGDTLRVTVVGGGTGGVWKVRAVSAEVKSPLHLVVRHGSTPPAVGDELECWVEREEGRGYRLSASDFGRKPIADTAAARYAAALGVLAEIATDGTAVPADAAARLAELKVLANGCLNRDRADWLTVWRLLGSPDSARLTDLRDLAQRTREAVVSGRAPLVDDSNFPSEHARWTEALAAAGRSLRPEAGEDARPAPEPEPDQHDIADEPPPHQEPELNPADSVPNAAFVQALTQAAAADRPAKAHEAVWFQLKADLLWKGCKLADSPIADVLREGPDGVFLYEVLAAGRSTYADLRTGATRLLEINHTLPHPADRLYLVSAEPPTDAWSPDTLRDVFGVHLLWWTKDGWAGDEVERAIGSGNSATA